MGFHFNGDMQVLDQIVDDGAGHLSFLLNVDGDLLGSTHNGTIRADGPVMIVSEQRMDGGANFFSLTNGNLYNWRVQAGGTAGLHMIIELAESQDTIALESAVASDDSESAAASHNSESAVASDDSESAAASDDSESAVASHNGESAAASDDSESAVTSHNSEGPSATADGPEG